MFGLTAVFRQAHVCYFHLIGDGHNDKGFKERQVYVI